MKPLFLPLALLTLLVFGQVPLPASDVTANELAQHLGVSVWRVSPKKLPRDLVVYLQPVRDGKQIGNASNGFEFHGKGDLVICAHVEEGTMLITISRDGFLWTPYPAGLKNTSFSVKHEIDFEAGPGTYLLCADYPLRTDAKNPLGVMVATGKIADATKGLALVLAAE